MTTVPVSCGSPAAVVPKFGLNPVKSSAEAVDLPADDSELGAVVFQPLRRALCSLNDLLITLTPCSRAEDVSDAEDRQATQFHDRLFRRTDDTTALAAVKVIKPASVPAPVFNTGLSAASVANFPTTRCHFFFR